MKIILLLKTTQMIRFKKSFGFLRESLTLYPGLEWNLVCIPG